MNRVPVLLIAAPMLFGIACGLGDSTGQEQDARQNSADASAAMDASQEKDSGVTTRDAGRDATAPSDGADDSGQPRDAGEDAGHSRDGGDDAGKDASREQDAGDGGGSAKDGGGTANDGGGSPGGAIPSPGCGKAPTLKNSPGTTINYNTVSVGGTSRRYILRIPENYDKNHPYRLILSYHWATGSASQVFNCHTEGIDCYTTQSPFFGLWDLANGSTIFIAPDGINGYWYNTGGQDVTFTDELLKQVEDDLCIDTTRIELEGFSMGGAMSYTLVCARPNVFRAAVVHSGGGQSLPTTCQPIAYFSSLGSQERGGQTSTSDFFAKTNGCTIETLPKPPTGGHVCTSYQGCSAGHPVRWCPFDGGHTPSPRDSGQNTTWMTKEVWSFLTQF